jgi:hypothetical protein
MRRTLALPSGWAVGPFLALVSFVALALSLLIDWGQPLPAALATLLISIAILICATAGSDWKTWSGGRHLWLVAILIVGLLNLRYPEGHGGREIGIQLLLIFAMTASAAIAITQSGRRAIWFTGATVVLWLLLVTTTWGAWGTDAIDVFKAVNGATGALLHGHNPYSPTFPYLVHVTPFIAAPQPGHFEYGPIVPMIYSLGWVVGDVRVMNVVAVLLIAAGLGKIAHSRGSSDLGHRICTLAIISPLNIFMIQNAWVEIYIVTAIVWWMAVRDNHVKWSVVLLAGGLMVNLLALPLILPFWIWSPRARRQIELAICLAIVIAIPFVVMTGITQFLYDIAGFQLSMPPWYNSLTLTSYLWQATSVTLPGWSMLVVGLFVVLFSIRLGPPGTIGRVALESALFLTLPLLVAKMAFFNYYFLSGTMIMLAVAEVGRLREDEVFALPIITLRRPLRLWPSPGWEGLAPEAGWRTVRRASTRRGSRTPVTTLKG